MAGPDMHPQDKQKLHRELMDYCEGVTHTFPPLLSGLPPDVATDIVNTRSKNFSRHAYTYRHTPLTCAALRGQSWMVQLLIQDYKADVNKAARASNPRFDGMTPLMLAASRGHCGIVDILIQAGCNVNTRENSGETAVFLACREGQHEVVEDLVKNGADINLHNHKGATCLMIALIREDERLAKILLEGGANPNTESKYKTFESMEREYCTGSFHIRRLSSTVDLYGSPSSFELEKCTTALHWAIKNHQSSIVSLLLTYEARMSRDEEGYSPLDLAFSYDSLDVVEILAGSRALSREEKIYSWEGLALLHPSLDEALRCLHHASEERKEDLLDFDPASATTPSDNCLQLHNAPFQTRMTRFLTRFQETLNEGGTLPFSHVTDVLDYCILRAEHEKMCGIAQERSDGLITFCNGAFLFGLKVAQDQEVGKLQQLACHLLWLNPLCQDGGSFLHVLAIMLWQKWTFLPTDVPFERLLAFLLNSGASVHAKDNDGDRPLHMIARCPSMLEGSEMLASMTRTLIKAGALVGVQNNAGLTPLKCAVTSTVSEILRPHFPPSLQSLAATEVRKNKIPFEDEIPQILHAFVKLH